MKRVDGGDQRLLLGRPARIVRAAQHRCTHLLVGQAGGMRERRDMDAPFVFATRERTGSVDDDLTFAQRQNPAIEQAATLEFLPGPRVAGDDPKQHQRRSTAHDPIELLLNFNIVRRLKRRDP
jgi:hypothetical protein